MCTGMQLEDYEALREKYGLEKAAAEARLAQERRAAQARLDKEVAAAAASASAAAAAASPSRPSTSHRNAGGKFPALGHIIRPYKHSGSDALEPSIRLLMAGFRWLSKDWCMCWEHVHACRCITDTFRLC